MTGRVRGAILAVAVIVVVGGGLVLGGGVRAQDGITLASEPSAARPGGWTVVTANITSQEAVGAVRFEVIYDPVVLSVIGCGSRFGPCNPELDADRAAFAIFSTQGLGEDAATVTFSVRGAAQQGETPINIEIRECVDLEGHPAECTGSSTTLLVDESAPAQGTPPADERTPDWSDEGIDPDGTVNDDLIVDGQEPADRELARKAGDDGGTNLTPWLLGALAVAVVGGAVWAAVWVRRRA
jgi:hypothetical protein